MRVIREKAAAFIQERLRLFVKERAFQANPFFYVASWKMMPRLYRVPVVIVLTP